MSSSPHAQRPLMRSYCLPAPGASPLATFGKTLVALTLVGASAVGIVSISRGSAAGPATPTVVAESAAADDAQGDLPSAAPARSAAAEPASLPAEAAAPLATPVAPIDGAASDSIPAAPAATGDSAEPAAAEPPAASDEPPASAESAEFVLPPMPPTFEPGRVRLVVDGGPTVNLRAAPSLSSPVLMVLLKGSIVEQVPGKARTASDDWRYVRWNQREGWIAANLVHVDTVPLQEVDVADQGIDYWSPVQPGVYALREISTGRPITDHGRPVYVDRDGTPVTPS